MTTPVVSLDEHRVDAPRRRRWWRSLIWLLIALLITVIVWAVWFSPLLAIRSVSVVGVPGEAAQAVRRTAAVPVGLPLAQLDAAAVAERVQGIDWVRSVEVRRGWPNGVVLAVEPRVPVALVADTAQAVDAGGVAFSPLGRMPSGLLAIDASGVALVAAVAVLQDLPPQLRARVTSISASTRDDVEFTLKPGTQVRWGSAESGALKAQVLSALLPRRPRMVDVTAPELPTTFGERPGPGNQGSSG